MDAHRHERHEEAVRLLRRVVGRRLTRDHRRWVDREAVFQDAYLAVHDLIDSSEEVEFQVVKAQIVAVSSNIAASAMRHAYAQRRGGAARFARLTSKSGSSLVDMYGLVDGTHTASRYMAREEIGAIVRIALRSLPERERRVAQLHWIDGMARGRIGELLDLNVNTVNTLLVRTKEVLARRITSAVGLLTSF